MISPILPAHDTDTIGLELGIFIARQSRHYRVSREAVIAAIREAIPSQPPTPAPAASTSTTAPVDVQAEGDDASLSADPSPVQAAESAPDHGSATAPKETASDEGESNSCPSARRHSSPDNRDGALAADLGTSQREDGASPSPQSENIPAPGGRPNTIRAAILQCHADNPGWPSKLIAKHVGASEDLVRATASKFKLTLVSWWDYQRAQKAATTEALKTEAAPKPTAPPEPPPAHTAEPNKAKRVTLADKIRAHLANHPDATLKELTDTIGGKMSAIGWAAKKAGIVIRKRTAEERSEASAKGARKRIESAEPVIVGPAPHEDATDVLHRVKRAPSGRFYLRDKATGHFVHQSLQPCPTGPGPLMTSDRKWAWYDTMERYRGAKKKWPELAAMRKEAASK